MRFQALILKRIKSLLKQNGITYAELAERLQVSESSVKRWFSKENMSLEKVDLVLEACEIQMQDLLKQIDDDKAPEEFTATQEAALGKDEKLMALFYILASGVPYSRVSKKFNFTASELLKKTLLLDRLKLVELGPKNKVRPLLSLSARWIPGGVLCTKYFHKLRTEFMDSHFHGEFESQHFISGRLSQGSISVIAKKIDRLGEELKELVELDRLGKQGKNTSIFLGFRPWSFSVVDKYLRP